MNKKQKQEIATALKYIMPIFSKYNFRWCISEGLARYIYDIDDNVKEIAIDLDVDKDDRKFKKFLLDVKNHTKLPLKHWKDKIYDHYVMEVIVGKTILSICPTQNMDIFDKDSGRYELFYKDGIPTPNIVPFENLNLPILPKDRFTKMEESFDNK